MKPKAYELFLRNKQILLAPSGITVYIYGLREPHTGLIRYIGKTTNPRRRWLNHLCEKSHCRRTYWIRSLLRRKFRPELVIIEEIRGAWPWQESERFWISFAKANGWPLVNMTSGGDGVPDWAATPKRYYGKEHWTHNKPEALARGNRNGSRRHPEFIHRGTQRPNSKLDDAKIKEIRKLAASGISHLTLAERFGVSRRNIHYIVSGKAWKHVS